MSGTYDYDTQRIAVSPGELTETVTAVTGLVNSIADDLNDIVTALNDLALSWVGDASDLATSFSDAYQKAVNNLYGTDQHPELGVFNRLLSGVQAAAENYDQAEQWVVGKFIAFGEAVGGSQPSSGDPNASTSVVNTDPTAPTTFITETF